MEPNLELRKVRDFGELISDTFIFFKQNWKPLLKSYVVICGVLVLGGMVTAILGQVKIFDQLSNTGFKAESVGDLFGDSSVANTVFLWLLSGCMSINTFCYISAYQDKGSVPPNVAEVWAYFKYYFFRLVAAQVVLIFIFLVGIGLFVFPGIYLLPIVSIVPAVMIFENASYGYAFDRGVKLIKDHWWMTFGALTVMLVAAYAGYILLVFTVSVVAGVQIALGSAPSIGMFMGATVLQYLLTVFMILPYIVTSLCYFSLVEKKDGVSLMERIERMGTDSAVDHQAEEQY